MNFKRRKVPEFDGGSDPFPPSDTEPSAGTSAGIGQAVKADGSKTRYELIPAEVWKLMLDFPDDRVGSFAEVALDTLIAYQRGSDICFTDFFRYSASQEAMDCMTDVLEFGAQKYAAWNWIKGMPHSRVVGSALRHIVEIANGNYTDEESGLTQLGHLCCNMLFLKYFVELHPHLDDRCEELFNGF